MSAGLYSRRCRESADFDFSSGQTVQILLQFAGSPHEIDGTRNWCLWEGFFHGVPFLVSLTNLFHQPLFKECREIISRISRPDFTNDYLNQQRSGNAITGTTLFQTQNPFI